MDSSTAFRDEGQGHDKGGTAKESSHLVGPRSSTFLAVKKASAFGLESFHSYKNVELLRLYLILTNTKGCLSFLVRHIYPTGRLIRIEAIRKYKHISPIAGPLSRDFQKVYKVTTMSRSSPVSE